MKTGIKYLLCAGIVCSMTVGGAMVSMAGTWQLGTAQNAGRWWYDNGDGTYAKSGWQWIDGNNDGIAECYYFDQNGWMLANTITPDGYTVNGDGSITVTITYKMGG